MNVETEIKAIVEHIDGLPKKDRIIVLDYLEHREWGIALEHLCATISEENIQISEPIFHLIKDVSTHMKIWEGIRDEIIDLVK